MIRYIITLTTLAFLFACNPVIKDDPSVASAISICAAGIDTSTQAKLEAVYEKEKMNGNVGFRFSEAAKGILDPNKVSDAKYSKYVECALEIDRRHRATTLESAKAPEDPAWITAQEFNKLWETKRDNGYYPSLVVGQCAKDGAERLQAEWVARPLGTSFYSYSVMTEDFYKNRAADLAEQGYILSSLNTFKDCSNKIRYQATWLKRDE